MAYRDIIFNKKKLSLHRASVNPDFGKPNVLASDTWDYVDLWLKRKNESSARFFWEQAKFFYLASLQLPKTSASLTAYYCILNATKALLTVKKIHFKDFHGVTGSSVTASKTTLSNETINIKQTGVLPSLSEYLGYTISSMSRVSFNLQDCLYNLPFLHRAFLLTYTSEKQLFIPIKNPLFVKSMTNHEAWFCADLEDEHADSRSLKQLPKNFEKDLSIETHTVIRCKKRPARFKWNSRTKKSTRIKNFQKYHNGIRKHVFYIYGNPTSWYLKKNEAPKALLLSPLILIFAAMHRLSELTRYEPEKLAKHFDCNQNWLLSEFIKLALPQFIDEISSEITGLEFKIPNTAI